VKSLVEAIKSYPPLAQYLTSRGDIQPKLYYFNAEGRAQITRYAFEKSDKKYVNHILTGEEFGALKSDPSSVVGQRFGSVPILEVGGVIIAQSIACAQLAADLGINANVTPQQRAVDMQLLGCHADIQSAVYKSKFGPDAEKKKSCS